MGDVNGPRDTNGCQVNFVSWNVKAMNNIVKRKKVLTHLKHLNIDIAFLQETHLRTIDQSRLKGGWIGQAYHSNFDFKARGVAILISKNVNNEIFVEELSCTHCDRIYILCLFALVERNMLLQ